MKLLLAILLIITICGCGEKVLQLEPVSLKTEEEIEAMVDKFMGREDAKDIIRDYRAQFDGKL